MEMGGASRRGGHHKSNQPLPLPQSHCTQLHLRQRLEHLSEMGKEREGRGSEGGGRER